jgi:hypothetical protein
MYDVRADVKLFIDVPEVETKRRRYKKSMLEYISHIENTQSVFEKMLCSEFSGDLMPFVTGKKYQDCKSIYKKENYKFVKDNKIYEEVLRFMNVG